MQAQVGDRALGIHFSGTSGPPAPNREGNPDRDLKVDKIKSSQETMNR